MKKSNIEFCGFVMNHATNKYPSAKYYAPANIGLEVWVYLYGTNGETVTDELLNERFEKHYKKKMTREQYDVYTKGWAADKRTATDCEGLLDAYVSNNVTADYCYNKWCPEKGEITPEIIPFLSTVNAAGCAVFKHDPETGKKTHVGFIIGRDTDGTPLVGEARGIAYGVTVTRLTERPFTHWGRPTAVLNFPSSNIVPNIKTVKETVSDPANTDRITALQIMLCAWGFPVTVDGKIGAETRTAFNEFKKTNPNENRINLVIDGETVFHQII